MEKLRCLIVDDETDIRELLAMTLDRMDLETYTAKNVEEAKTLLKQRSYALCLTDMQMPDGTGLDLVKHIGEFHTGLPVAERIQTQGQSTASLLDVPPDISLRTGAANRGWLMRPALKPLAPRCR